jgi:hypothetical protein
VERYQVLCRDVLSPNTPVMPELAEKRFYSVCLNGQMFRRTNLIGSVVTPTPQPDMGTRTMGLPERPSETDEADMAGAADLAPAADMRPLTPFEALSPSFICSDEIRSAAATLEARISGLQNGRDYEFVVVAIDGYGNPRGSAGVTGRPRPALNLLDALHRSGNWAGCALAGRGGPAGPAPVLLLLLSIVGLRLRRRTG